MIKQAVRSRIEETGIVPAIRVSSPHDALFAAEALFEGGIPIVEITMTVPEALDVVAHLVQHKRDLIVGAGTVLDAEMAAKCLGAGAHFLTSTGFDRGMVELAVREEVLVMPGALTPTEVMAASKAGADVIKIFPCLEMGGPRYIRALKAPFPNVPMMAAGGVNQQTTTEFILAGAVAVGVGAELVPHDAIQQRDAAWIRELARRFAGLVQSARRLLAG